MPRRLLPIGLALAVIALTPASADGEAKAIWGPTVMPDGTSPFPIYRDLGVDVFQLQLNWAAIARTRPAHARRPSDPAYRWPPVVDTVLAEAKQNHIKVALLVKNTPGWANGGLPRNWAPSDPRDYARFLAAASRRYPAVRRWMIWGEPNRAESFSPMPANAPEGPRRYAMLLDRSYAELKKVHRRNKVIGGMTFTTGEVSAERFVHWMLLPNGRPPRLDWYGHDPYGARFPSLRLRPDPARPGARDFGDLDTLARQVRRTYKRRHRDPKLWISEFGVGTTKRAGAYTFFVSEAEQARWIRAAYRIAHRWKRVAGLGWFTLIDGATHGFGLLRADGTPKPGYVAYRRAR